MTRQANPIAHTPSRDDSGTTCPVCAAPFTPTGRQRYCSTTCRKTAFRRRHAATQPAVTVPAPGARRDRTVYECGTCNTRLLGQQRCPDCNTFGRSLGLGGTCPCCDDIITLTDLDLDLHP